MEKVFCQFRFFKHLSNLLRMHILEDMYVLSFLSNLMHINYYLKGKPVKEVLDKYAKDCPLVVFPEVE